jgi:hypothetical protein
MTLNYTGQTGHRSWSAGHEKKIEMSNSGSTGNILILSNFLRFCISMQKKKNLKVISLFS